MQSLIVSKGTAILRNEVIERMVQKLFSGGSATIDNILAIKKQEGKNAISINQARELIRFINIKPTYSVAKVAYVKEAQALSIAAQNALLKVIEEPPKYAKIILSVDHKDNLLSTVVSRCEVMEMSDRLDYPYGIDDQTTLEFIDILKFSLGERIDWVTRNKGVLKDREYAIKILTAWIFVVRQLMMISSGIQPDGNKNAKMLIQSSNKADLATWKANINRLQGVLLSVKLNNANSVLGIESYLLNMPA